MQLSHSNFLRFFRIIPIIAVVIELSLPLVAFGNGIPVGLVRLYAMLFHKSVDEVVLSVAADSTEMVKVVPELHIEAVAMAS